jgi:hypothetical protein
LNVNRLTSTPVKSWPAADALGAGSALADGAAADVAGADDGVVPVQAVAMKIAVIAAATERYRDTTWDPPLAVIRSVQHIGQVAVGWTI